MENVPTASEHSSLNVTPGASSEAAQTITGDGMPMQVETELATKLDKYSLESIVEWKISRFLDQIGTYYPDDLHSLIMKKVEKPLIAQILKRTGGNQVHASRILGINRNTLRKKMKIYGLAN